ncbi:MAG TPA: TPM domain-containing protein [Puia sp.]|nr:TPM domain-containing protein [Puia sp.]
MKSLAPLLLFLLLAAGVRSGIPLAGVRSTAVVRATHRDSIPRPVGFVNDFEDLFTPGQKDTLEQMLHAFEQRTTIEIAVMTVDTSLTMSPNFDVFIRNTMNAWGVGKKETNNGILVGISRTYRRIRIQNGYGIEKVLSNAETKKIIDEAFLPLFRKGRYYEGVVNGLRALMQRLE